MTLIYDGKNSNGNTFAKLSALGLTREEAVVTI
jgi:hypothetical protein